MNNEWGKAIITDIKLAVHVIKGDKVHKNRASHGLVLNDENSIKNIYFSDGTVIKTDVLELHYLPKGSDYTIETVANGTCWAINFELLNEIKSEPFSMNFRNSEPVITLFKEANQIFWQNKPYKDVAIRKILYDIILLTLKEKAKNYMPSQKELLIKPGVNLIDTDFTNNDLSVKKLAQLSNISEAYFRRIFTEIYSMSPKEYIINKRMEYAKTLLSSGQVEVQEAAVMCGYFEPCHFSREFSKYFGVSPKEYAKKNSGSL